MKNSRWEMETITRSIEVAETVTCDICGKVYDVEEQMTNTVEFRIDPYECVSEEYIRDVCSKHAALIESIIKLLGGPKKGDKVA